MVNAFASPGGGRLAAISAFRSQYTSGVSWWRMKPLPAPEVPGKTEFERFDNAMRQVLSVSKEELLRREAREKRAKVRKKQTRKP
jgi:hypothetical protein